MNRKFRLTRSDEFQRVKQTGTSYAHPFLILIKSPNPDLLLRIGITAGRTVGNAILRNRAKRRMRASLNVLLTSIQPGWDLVFLARKTILEATHTELIAAEKQLLKRAGIYLTKNGPIDG